MNLCKAFNLALTWCGTGPVGGNIRWGLTNSIGSTRGYYRRSNKHGIKFNRKVGKHWNCRNARDKSLEIIHSRNTGMEAEVATHSGRLFVEDEAQAQDEQTQERVLTRLFSDSPFTRRKWAASSTISGRSGDDVSSLKKALQISSKNSPPETNFLTWAAKEQLRFLHQSDPSEWTPERLSECFPISVHGVKKLLSSTFTMDSPARIRLHDLHVLNKWKVLCSGSGGPLSADTIGPLHDWKLRMEHAAGNSNLPMPPPKPDDLPNSPSSSLDQHPGIFESIIKNADNPLLTSGAIMCRQQVDRSVVECEPMQFHKRNKSRVMKADEFMQNLLEELRTTKASDISDKTKQYQQWITEQIEKLNVSNQPRHTNSVELEKKTVIKDKYITRKQPLVRWDVSKNQKLAEAYIYTSSGGYQHPCGKADDEPLRVMIPRRQRQAGRMYQKGDTFYDDDGEFLYRVPGLKRD